MLTFTTEKTPMYPTLSDALKDLLGIDIPLPFPSFGFFVAIAFLVAAHFFTKELKRKEKLRWLFPINDKVKVGEKASISELVINALFGFIIAFKVVEMFLDYDALVANPQDFLFSSKGNFLGGIIGAALFGFLKYKEKDREKLPQPKWVDRTLYPHELVGNMTMIAAIAGILGAKLFHNLENIEQFTADPIDALLSFSGLSIYGGLIVGGGAVLYYASRQGMHWIHVADACAPGLMAAYGVGRIGCQVSGDGDWGMPNDAPKPDWMGALPDWMWAYDYPNNVLGVDLKEQFTRDGFESFHGLAWPTPFYETVMAGIIFIVLWSLRKRLNIPGLIFSIYLLLNGIERFFIEKIRINPDYQFLGIEATQAEIIAVLMMFTGIGGIIYFYRNQNKFIPRLKKQT